MILVFLIVVVVVLLLIVVVLLLVWLVLLVRLVWIGLLIVQPQVNEDVRDVVLQSESQPLALLSELGVVFYRVLHLLLLRTKCADAVRKVRDAPKDWVLVVEAC